MRTAYDNLIEESVIEESYGIELTKGALNKMNKLFTGLLKEFNLIIT